MMFQGQGRSEAGSSVLERPSQPTFHPPRREGSVPPAQMSSRLSSPPPPSYRPPGGSGNGSFLGSSSSSSQTYPTPTVSSATSLFSSSSFEGESPGGRPSPYQSHQSHHASPYQGHSSYSPATVSAPPPSGAGTPSSSSSSSSLPQHQHQQQHQQQQQHQYHAGSAASPPRSPGQHSSDSEQADYNREDTPFNREDTPFNREGSINPEKALKNKHVVEWLKAYIELSPDQSISRNDLYEYYRETTNIKPSVDPATFGKIVRTVFPNIATRRLGKRGFSKYHYAGIAKRPNPVPPQFDSLSDSYNDFQKARSLEPQTFLRAREGSMPPFQRASTAAPSEPPASYGSFSRSSSVTPGGPNAQQPQSQSQSQFQSQQAQQQAQQQAHQQAQQQQFQAQQQSLSRKRTWEEARPERFLEMYHKHMQDFTDSVVHLNFQKTEECLRFWKRLSHEELEMANQSSMSARIREVDEHAYQVILQNFIPNPLLPTPTDKIQNIRYFAKSYEYWLVVALERAPKSLAYLKLLCASTFTVDLKRRTSLNHLSKGVASLLTKPEMIYMMLDNWKRLDFESIKDQTQWSISEDSQMFDEFYSEFAHFLGANASLHEWASWFERFTFKYVDMKTENLVEFIQSAKRFLMNWTFFGSLLIRDLTLRSSNSFGAFHILKLFFDELFFYMLENRYAQFKKVCSFEKDFTFTVHPPEVRNGGTPGRIPGASNQSSSSSSSSRKEASYRDFEGHSSASASASAPASAPAPTYPHDGGVSPPQKKTSRPATEDYLGLLDQPPPHASFMPSHSWKPSSPQGNFSFPALPDYQRPSQGNGSHPHPSPSSRSQPMLPHQAHYGLDDD